MLNEQETIARAQSGDMAAVRRMFQPHLLTFAAGMLRDRDGACDAVQEAFVQAFLHIDRFEPQRSFRPSL